MKIFSQESVCKGSSKRASQVGWIKSLISVGFDAGYAQDLRVHGVSGLSRTKIDCDLLLSVWVDFCELTT